ncbi:MAG: hypothetical protein AAGF11_33880 [Myxococcota bacterium]
MVFSRGGALGLVGALALMMGACVTDRDNLEIEALEGDMPSFRSDEGLGHMVSTRPGHLDGGGDWIGNGLDDVDLGGIDVDYGLSTSAGMSERGSVLMNEHLRGTAEYLVECALPARDRITKVVGDEVLEFRGRLGLAPEWKDGACDVDCQQWVSACLLARTNATGQEIDIWVSGDHPSLGLGTSPEFPHYEATYYGNLFEDGAPQYLCQGSTRGVQIATRQGRTCAGGDPAACGFEVMGSCEDAMRCRVASRKSEDFYVECAEGERPAGRRYHSISVYVRDLGA